MSNEMFTRLPTTGSAQLSDIICAVQGFSSSSATLPDASLYYSVPLGTSGTEFFTQGPLSVTPPTRRFSLGSTTTIYLSVLSAFSGGSGNTVCGGIYARRRR